MRIFFIVMFIFIGLLSFLTINTAETVFLQIIGYLQLLIAVIFLVGAAIIEAILSPNENNNKIKDLLHSINYEVSEIKEMKEQKTGTKK
ncbi:MAG: hypothetical protein ACKE9I_09915 [Methylophagaceae bacterium]